MRNVEPALFAPSGKDQAQEDFSCANCHGGAEDWILSHTRPDYPRAALVKLGMRPLGSAYQRANSCAACHQRHTFSRSEARHSEACRNCHQGADYPHLETVANSRHGVAYDLHRDKLATDSPKWVAGEDYDAAPTCAGVSCPELPKV